MKTRPITKTEHIDVVMKYSISLLLFFLLVTELHANALYQGDYICKSNGQSLVITKSSLLIGSANFEYFAKLSNNRVDAFVYNEDAAFAFPVAKEGIDDKNEIQIQFWNFYDFKNKKSPKLILVCTKK